MLRKEDSPGPIINKSNAGMIPNIFLSTKICNIGYSLPSIRTVTAIISNATIPNNIIATAENRFDCSKSLFQMRIKSNLWPDSINMQSSRDYQWVVIDGNSSDDTYKFLDSLKKGGSQLKWISEDDSGIYNAMNKYISKCYTI